MFLDAVKRRVMPCVGWTVCSFLFVIAGWISGAGIGYLSSAMGWVVYPDVMFSKLTFLVFPFVGGIIGLIAMHAIRVLCWKKLQRKYREKHERWMWKHTIGIILFDEVIWLVAFSTICAVLVIVL